MGKFQRLVAITAGLATIIGALNTYFGLPIPGLLLFNKHTVSRIWTESQFSIEAIKTVTYIAVESGDSFSYSFGLPLSARGRTTLADGDTVWVVLQDQAGQYYLQYPPVNIRSGGWTATNIRPLHGIKRIIFARVDAENNQRFLRRVQHNEWGKFSALPSGSSEVAFVELN